jgi:hypothetical protein
MGAGEIYKRLTIILSVNDAATAQLSTVSSSLRSFAGVTTQATGQLAKLSHRFMQVGRALVSFLIIRTIGVQFGRFIALMFEGNQVLEKATTSLERLGGSLGYAQKQIEFIRKTAMRAPFDFQSILQASRLLVAYGKDLQTYLPILLDWAAALGATSGMLEGYAAAMGKIMAGSPYVLRILTTRAVGLDQWRYALEQTNRELPKAERFAQALTFALKRFEGQAVILAKTMAGLRTNIRDVWVEITREIGLAMFTRIRGTLFELYEGMRDIADNQREILYEIGDIFGLWAGRIILIIKSSAKLGTYWNKMAVVIKNIAIFLVGRMLITAVVRVVYQLGFALKTFWAMSVAAKAVTAGLNLAALAAGAIAKAILDAKMMAIDFNIALGDITSGLSILIDFSEREEKVFTRQEISSLRTMQIGIREVITSLSDMGRKFAAMRKDVRPSELLPGGIGAINAIRNRFIAWRNSFSVDALQPMIADLRDFVVDADPLMEKLFGDKTWGERVTVYVDALAEMAKAYERSEIVPDEDAWHNMVQKMGAEVLGIVPMLEPWFALSEKIRESSEGTAQQLKLQQTNIDAIKFILEDYEGYQLGIADAWESTAENTIVALRALEEGMVDMAGWLPLYQAIARVEKDVETTEADRVKVAAELFDKQVEAWDYTVRIAEAQSKLTDNTVIYSLALETVIAQMRQLVDSGIGLTPEQWKQVHEALLGYQNALKDVLNTTNELSFATYSAFSLWQQALNPIVSLVGAIADGAKDMGKAFESAMKAMLKWALQLAAQLTILVILMSIFKLVSGGMGGFGGALSALLGGGVSPAGSDFIGPPTSRAFGMRGPELAFAGGDITPRAQAQPGGGETHIHMENAIVLDGESFMRMVDDAQYKLERRKGGGV